MPPSDVRFRPHHQHHQAGAAADVISIVSPPPNVTMCCNAFCRRTSPGDGPTCRWHVRNYGSTEQPIPVTLCNACKINFDQGKYCPFCVQIYREKDPDSFDSKEWIGCGNRSCRRWVHVHCEAEAGYDIHSRFAYQCPSCRENLEVADKKRLGRHNAADRLGVGEGRSSPDLSEKLPDQRGETEEDEVSSEDDLDKPLHAERNGTNSPPSMDPVSSNSIASSSLQEVSHSSVQQLRKQRKPFKVDLSKLQTSSLRRYKQAFNLNDVSVACRDELKTAVARHFSSLVVSEKELLEALLNVRMKRKRVSAGTSMSLTRL